MTKDSQISIYKAHPSQFNELTNIARSSKKHWGYPDAWIKLWDEDLRLTKDYIESHKVTIISENGETAGFCVIDTHPIILEILHFWILPEFMGKGLGKQLLIHALTEAINPQTKTIQVISDPNAVGFYEKFGLRTAEFVDSSPGDRKLPLMKANNETLFLK